MNPPHTRRSFSLLFVLLAALGINSSTPGQVMSSSNKTADLESYTRCHFDDGLEVVAVDALAPGVNVRSVETASGERGIKMSAGYRVMFAYPGTDFFANAKAEKLPSESYAEEKQVLLENFRYLLASSPENHENLALPSTMNGLEVHGFDRDKLAGGVLGFCLLLDDRAHIALTIYVLNQEASARKFKDLNEYAQLRDRYLHSYTRCIEANNHAKETLK